MFYNKFEYITLLLYECLQITKKKPKPFRQDFKNAGSLIEMEWT